ncbi:MULTISPECIES: mechanosensitive ion channel family protein [Gordonia]|uniref:Mechanosensitive ion channel protein MscS n=2 Tax=Gordonia alkanivorans TaxID=84096 RepID=W9DFJ3_9ACTN|nr:MULTISPECIES: mechanosensitive ion channel family protein [Gordonia]AZZ81389.1 mechanosensitive ion channel family protein [Gordonia alkanivorans]ETA07227.1 mechanosensitive ion channel protein MscS [Gordonia alkanivorans CGMCC 6845]MDH3009285.1 mechanosensitive ion channel family protein [Gordonia alkanivorans]MDH3010599.1 mechanosensitive ion channel family protein [Gordonia alkanivorans]MDH3018181.1 mechanosensitive ion channel family protein [Gordonia alkanivorans]
MIVQPGLELLAAAPSPTELLIGRVYVWLATSGLEIVIWILGAVLLARVIRWFAGKYAARVETRFSTSDLIVQTEDAKHRRALVDVVAWTLIVGIAIVVVIHILGVFGIPLSGLTGPTAVIGAALGFGAQRIVQDILAGFFVVAEKQYGYGDVVNLTVTGNAPAEGTVEDVTLRVTKLRTTEGEVITVPNGQIIKATNLSKDWARAVVDVPVPSEADIGLVNDTLDRVGHQFYELPRWHDILLDAPSSLGVINLELDSITVRMVTRTLPGKQFEVGRALRVHIIRALAREGIMVPAGREVQAAGGPPATLADQTGRDRDEDE